MPRLRPRLGSADTRREQWRRRDGRIGAGRSKWPWRAWGTWRRSRRTRRPQMNRNLERYSAFDFGGGLDIKTSPLALSMRKVQDRLTKADNMVYSTSKAASKRLPYATYNTVTLGANVTISGGVQLRHSNGTDFVLCGTSDGRLVQLNVDGTTANITTGKSTGRRWDFDVYNDKAIAVNGADAPMKWDGTTFGTLGGSPPTTASTVVVHSNRVFMLDETLTSRLTWSALNNEEDY